MSKDRRHITLLATCMSYALVILDTSIVNVALEELSRDLGTNIAGLQWIVAAYVLVFASLVLSGGVLSDRYGARKTYMTGLVALAIGSLVSACAPSFSVLIAGRAMQGVGAALLVPGALSLIRYAYPRENDRAKAIASWSSAGGLAQILGPILGGALLAVSDWRSIFLVNVPICLGGLWLTARIDNPVDNRGGMRIDWSGQLSATLAVVLMIGAVIEAREFGWGSPTILTAFALSVLSLTSFVMIERRSESPVLPLSLFENPTFSWIIATALIGAIAFFGMLFVLNLYFLQDAGYTPLQTAVAMLPLALLATVGNLSAGRFVQSVSSLTVMLLGAVFLLTGFALVAAAGTNFPYPLFALALMLIGFGGGLRGPMMAAVILSTIDKKYTGVASGILTATSQLGASIGVAIFGALLADSRQIASSMRVMAIFSAASTALILLILWYLRRQRARAPVRPRIVES